MEGGREGRREGEEGGREGGMEEGEGSDMPLSSFSVSRASLKMRK